MLKLSIRFGTSMGKSYGVRQDAKGISQGSISLQVSKGVWAIKTSRCVLARLKGIQPVAVMMNREWLGTRIRPQELLNRGWPLKHGLGTRILAGEMGSIRGSLLYWWRMFFFEWHCSGETLLVVAPFAYACWVVGIFARTVRGQDNRRRWVYWEVSRNIYLTPHTRNQS